MDAIEISPSWASAVAAHDAAFRAYCAENTLATATAYDAACRVLAMYAARAYDGERRVRALGPEQELVRRYVLEEAR